MRLLAFGILAAVLSAGCALEAGDPGQTVETAETGNSTTLSVTTPAKIRTASAAPTGTAPNPEPSPWFPQTANVAMPDDDNENPEPSPWQRPPPVESQAGANPGNTQANTGSGRSSGSEMPTEPLHIIGHRDVSDPQL
jgi:hypothetical protein